MSRAQLTSTVEQNTGGAVAPFVAGKNKIINGDFGIWQRGTSFGSGILSYTADRWTTEQTANATVTRQAFTPGAAPVSGYESQYYLRYVADVAGSIHGVNQKIENVQTLAGQVATLSLWMKADAAGTYLLNIDQNFGTGGSGSSPFVQTTISVTTSWQRFTFTTTIPSIAGFTVGTGSDLRLRILNTSNATFAMNIWGVQLEAGSVATPFTTATGTLSGELAACQRYYYRQNAQVNYNYFGQGFADSTTTALILLTLPSTMRITPTVLDYSTLNLTTGGTNTTVTSMTILAAQSGLNNVSLYAAVASGLTVNRPYSLTSNGSTNGYIGVGAEL